ncbi:MAG: hypothetical protein RL477_783 [Pseudomonadota bacterium]|jgi:NADH dehydrogenase
MGPRQVTVFGASGFLGRHVVRRLAADGVRIVAAGRDPEAAAFLRTMGDVGQIAPLACDVRDPGSVARALAGSDAAVNLVGILYERGRNTFDAIHGEAPGIIARAAAAAGLGALVHVSAIGANVEAQSDYARSKGEGEVALREAFPDAVILRPSVVFGPEDDFFNRFACLARFVPALPLFGGGNNRFQPVYVCDVAEAVVRSLARSDARGRTFELGGPRVASFRELMETILALTGRRRGLVSLPMGLASVIGFFGDVGARLGIPPQLTRDQARLLRTDNVASADGLAALGIRATAMDVVLPTYLDRFRRAGRFSPSRI